jgi:hypothetical protein
MATRRVRISRSSHSHLHLDTARENSLLFGHTLFGRESLGDFENEEERREAWEHHRARLMVELPPGRRPDAFWRFDRAMPKGAESESHAIHMMADTSAGERTAIEMMWLEWITTRLEWRAVHGTDLTFRDWRHPPADFVAKHGPAIEAEVRAKYPNSRYF